MPRPKSKTRRAIDDIPQPQVAREIEVLGMGMSRTGTGTTAAALNMLGYRSYHANQIWQFDQPGDNHIECWREATQAKMYGNSRPYGKAEFQKLLRNYSAVTDVPCICFPEELIASYPTAKVILTTRDPSKWILSVESRILSKLESDEYKWVRAVGAIDPVLMGPYLDWINLFLRYWTGGDWQNREKLTQAMLDHNENIRKLVPQGKLLEWNLRDGWEPLCEFLDKPVPTSPLPHENAGDSDASFHKILAAKRATLIFGSMVLRPLLVTLLVLGGSTVILLWKLG